MDEEKNVNVKIVPPLAGLPKLIMAVAAVLVLFLAIAAVSQVFGVLSKVKEAKYIGRGSQYQNAVSVTGEGKVSAKPDIGQVSLGVVSDAATVSSAMAENTQKMNKVAQAMRDLGVKEEDMKTTNYSIYPRYQYIAGRNDIIGYEVTQTLEVKIRDIEKSGQFLEKAAIAGANQIGSLSFTFDNPDGLKEEARQKAIADAKQKAAALAASLGVSLGKIVGFSESSSQPTPGPFYAADGRGGGGAAPEIQTGQNEVQVNVAITYEIY